tara:strand:- start:241 stop:501 length:261 start_codon:yes stop_codon:yes gene_type:complete
MNNNNKGKNKMRYKYKKDTSSIATGQVLDDMNNIKVGDKIYFNDIKNNRNGYFKIKGIVPVITNNDNIYFYYTTTGGDFDCSHILI